jgi:hypothetical protein
MAVGARGGHGQLKHQALELRVVHLVQQGVHGGLVHRLGQPGGRG